MTCNAAHQLVLMTVMVGGVLGCRSTQPVPVSPQDATGPSFTLEAIPVMREGQPGIALYLGLRPRSFIFTHADTAYQAVFEVLVRFWGTDGRLHYEQAYDDTLWVRTFAATQTYNLSLWHRFIPYRPGRYRLEVRVTDRNTQRHAAQRRTVQLPETTSPRPALSPVWLEHPMASGRYEVWPGWHLAAGKDSLQAVVELYRLAPAHRIQVQMVLLRFPTDTSAARPPYDLMPAPGALNYLGVWYDRPETLQVSRREVAALVGEARITFRLPPLVERGVYRVEVSAHIENQRRPALSRRELVVHGATFPYIETLPELIEALAYLTYPEEQQALRSATTQREQRARFDAFWGRLIGDRRKAARLLRLYYERVEQANLQFTSFKEGWRTDRGMVYILLGPPLAVETRPDEQVWYYTYNEQDSRYRFVFERVHYTEATPLVHYVLRRQSYYYNLWQRVLERWRSGQVL